MNTIRKTCFFLLLISFFLFETRQTARAQIYTGGTMGVNYNNGYVLELAPILGYKYKIIEYGVSPFLSYLQSQGKYSFGGRAFTEVTFYKDISAHAEIQVANVEKISNNVKTRDWVLALPLGISYKYKISKGVYANGMILYDVIQNAGSPSKMPIIRGGIIYQP